MAVQEDERDAVATGRRDRVLLGATIASKITEYIKSHGLAEGDPLPSEAELADEYDVSQRVVRDALRALSQQGVIQTRQGKRAVVSELRPVAVYSYFRFALESDDGAVDDLLELRLALETNAARLAALRLTEDDLGELRRLQSEIRGLGDDRARRARLDLQFHTVIVRAAGNRFFDAILDVLGDVLFTVREKGVAIADHSGHVRAESQSEHEAILDALAARDTARAEQAMRMHLENVQRRFQDPLP